MGGKINPEKDRFFYDNQMRLGHLVVKLYSGDESDTTSMIKGFIKDDLTISISNQWGTVDGFVNNKVKEMAGNATDIQNQVLPVLGVLNGGNSISRAANSKVVTYADYAKRYEGSTVKLPDSIEIMLITDDHESDITSKLKEVLNISIGSFAPLGKKYQDKLNAASNNEGGIGVQILNQAMELAGEVEEGNQDNKKQTSAVSDGSFFGLANAPNGYEYDPSVINRTTYMKGTIRMEIANKYVIPNLLISSCDITFSKEMTKVGNGPLKPLYIKLTLQLEPANLVLKEGLEKIIK